MHLAELVLPLGEPRVGPQQGAGFRDPCVRVGASGLGQPGGAAPEFLQHAAEAEGRCLGGEQGGAAPGGQGLEHDGTVARQLR